MAENTSLEVRDIEKRELNASVNSYVENRNELLERVPELIDWDMFRRKISPELVDVLQMHHKRLEKRGVTIWTQESGMKKGWESGKVYYLQNESRHQDGPCFISVLKKKIKRFKEYRHKNGNSIWFHDKGWNTYFVRQEPGEENKLSSENMEFTRSGLYGRESDYSLEQNFKQEQFTLWIKMFSFWILIGVVSGLIYFLPAWFLLITLPVTVPPEIILGGCFISAGCLDVVLRVRLIMLYLRYKCRVKSHKVLKSIRQQWPDFCMEKFISMASNRLKCIFYADSMAEIGDFVSCDLSNALADYANVVDCETLDFQFKGMSEDENYYYIDVRQKVLLTGDWGSKVKRKKPTVKLRFMRPKESIMSMDFYRDWYIGEMKVDGKWF